MTHPQDAHPIAPEMRAEILARLAAIEKGHDVTVLYRLLLNTVLRFDATARDA